ncbi:hypothetical protein [Paraburkholderia agricolaris]|jgi:hypothetical protein|uniref:hypothetical protein n=1 Tax=Paraburkholderia agricolaris TaxID=2152888 RepID=UPI00129130AA|nr:hypothetical protein [Paraburkholderia agricolaris]
MEKNKGELAQGCPVYRLKTPPATAEFEANPVSGAVFMCIDGSLRRGETFRFVKNFGFEIPDQWNFLTDTVGKESFFMSAIRPIGWS